MAPKDTPDAIVTKLNAAVSDVLKDADVKEKFDKLGVQVEIMGVDATAKFINAFVEKATHEKIKDLIDPIGLTDQTKGPL